MVSDSTRAIHPLPQHIHQRTFDGHHQHPYLDQSYHMDFIG